MKFFNGEKVELVLTPSEETMNNVIQASHAMMAEKLDAWILDRLTIEQLENCIKQMQDEIEKRNRGE